MAKKNAKLSKNISSTERLEELLTETQEELDSLEPQIERLEKQLDKLKELKLAKQKLITLKLSIKSILENFSKSDAVNITTPVKNLEAEQKLSSYLLNKSVKTSLTTKKTYSAGAFFPELAFQEVAGTLRKKTSINYELFRAIVLNGGRATTEEIKQYLVENRIKQPASGDSFENVELTDISSRINYLVRKNLVKPEERGTFVSCLGWAEAGG